MMTMMVIMTRMMITWIAYKEWCNKLILYISPGINVDHGINADQHSKPRNKCKYSIQYLHLLRGFEC
jgi:hypothetical protein